MAKAQSIYLNQAVVYHGDRIEAGTSFKPGEVDDEIANDWMRRGIAVYADGSTEAALVVKTKEAEDAQGVVAQLTSRVAALESENAQLRSDVDLKDTEISGLTAANDGLTKQNLELLEKITAPAPVDAATADTGGDKTAGK